MIKNKMVKIRQYANGEVKEILLGECELFRLFSIYKGIELENGTYIEDIIKVSLRADKKTKSGVIQYGLNTLIDGIEINDEMYFPLLTSPSLMKSTDKIGKVKFEGSFYFINNKEIKFKEIMEKVASMNKIVSKKEQPINIQKDIVSRLGLLTSTSTSVKIEDYKYCILPEYEYEYESTYIKFADKLDKEGNIVIDLDKVTEEMKSEKLILEHIIADGCGFASNEFMDKMQKALEMDYKLNFCIFRQTGNATKGALVRFDYKHYLKEEYGITELKVKDAWGNPVDIMQVDLVLNKSQVKWCKWFESQDEIERLKNIEKDNIDYYKYKDVINSFAITKVNKPLIEEYFLSNYQIFDNLAISKEEIEKLGAYTEDIYRRVIAEDTDTIRLMLGDIINEDEWIEADDKDVKEYKLNASTKAHKLLQIDEKMMKCSFSRQVVESLINKQVHLLAGGKMILKGNYKLCIADPISYFDIVAEKGDLESKNNGLKPKSNYVNMESGKRVLARNPIANATEIVKTELSDSEVHKKYIGDITNEIIFFAKDNNLQKMSGADEDGDITACIDEEIIYNSVIENIDSEGNVVDFLNHFDKKDGNEKIYNDENLYESFCNVKGSLIAEYSDITTKVSNILQGELYLDKEDNKYYTYKHLYSKWYKDKILNKDEEILEIDKNIGNKKETIEILNEDSDNACNEDDYNYIETELKKNTDKLKELKQKKYSIFNKKLKNDLDIKKYTMNYETGTEKERKETVINAFKQYKNLIYYTTYLSMCAIDSPKTGVKPTEEMKGKLEYYKKIKMPYFHYHAKYKKRTNKSDSRMDKSYSNSPSILNDYANKVNGEIGYTERKKRWKEEVEKQNDIHFTNQIINHTLERNEELNELLTNFTNEFFDKTKKINAKNLDKEKSRIFKNELDVELQLKFDSTILSKFDAATILNEYAKINITRKGGKRGTYKVKANAQLICRYAFEQVVEVLMKDERNIFMYDEVSDKDETEENKIEFKHKYYIKEACTLSYDSITKKETIQKLKKIGGLETRIMRLTEITFKENELITLTNKEVIGSNGDVIGKEVINADGEVIGLIPTDKMIDEGKYKVVVMTPTKTGKSFGLNLLAS